MEKKLNSYQKVHTSRANPNVTSDYARCVFRTYRKSGLLAEKTHCRNHVSFCEAMKASRSIPVSFNAATSSPLRCPLTFNMPRYAVLLHPYPLHIVTVRHSVRPHVAC